MRPGRRREEGEAFYNQRQASAAAADFNHSGKRREKAAAEFADMMAEQQRAHDEAQTRSRP